MGVGCRMVWLTIFAMVVSVHSTTSNACVTDADCNGHNATLFCGSIVCSSGSCIQAPNPCTQVCSEKLRKCVECEVPSDCPMDGQICSLNNTCRWCFQNSDCPSGTWCEGGQWICASEQCAPPGPSARPCAKQEACSEEYKNCKRCNLDSDCSNAPYDWCTNRVYCNTTSHQCINEGPLPTPCRVCDSERRECLECQSDAHCRTTEWQLSQPHCIPPNAVPRCVEETCELVEVTHASMLAYWQLPCPRDTDTLQYECNEQQKRCVQHLAGAEVPSLLLDIGSANAVARSVYMNRLNEVPTPCQVNSDCRRLGWLCRTVSELDTSERVCVPCRNDAQCISGSGYSSCNIALGMCSEPVSDEEPSITIALAPNQQSNVITIELPKETGATAPTSSTPSTVKVWHTSATLEGEWSGLGDPFTLQLLVAAIIVCVLAALLVLSTLRNRKHLCQCSFCNKEKKVRKADVTPLPPAAQPLAPSSTSASLRSRAPSKPKKTIVVSRGKRHLSQALSTVFEDY